MRLGSSTFVARLPLCRSRNSLQQQQQQQRWSPPPSSASKGAETTTLTARTSDERARSRLQVGSYSSCKRGQRSVSRYVKSARNQVMTIVVVVECRVEPTQTKQAKKHAFERARGRPSSVDAPKQQQSARRSSRRASCERLAECRRRRRRCSPPAARRQRPVGRPEFKLGATSAVAAVKWRRRRRRVAAAVCLFEQRHSTAVVWRGRQSACVAASLSSSLMCRQAGERAAACSPWQVSACSRPSAASSSASDRRPRHRQFDRLSDRIIPAAAAAAATAAATTRPRCCGRAAARKRVIFCYARALHYRFAQKECVDLALSSLRERITNV